MNYRNKTIKTTKTTRTTHNKIIDTLQNNHTTLTPSPFQHTSTAPYQIFSPGKLTVDTHSKNSYAPTQEKTKTILQNPQKNYSILQHKKKKTPEKRSRAINKRKPTQEQTQENNTI